MLSPRHAHGFANNSDLINYERGGSNTMTQTQRINGKPNTAATGTRPKPLIPGSSIINPQNIQMVS